MDSVRYDSRRASILVHDGRRFAAVEDDSILRKLLVAERILHLRWVTDSYPDGFINDKSTY